MRMRVFNSLAQNYTFWYFSCFPWYLLLADTPSCRLLVYGQQI